MGFGAFACPWELKNGCGYGCWEVCLPRNGRELGFIYFGYLSVAIRDMFFLARARFRKVISLAKLHLSTHHQYSTIRT